MSEPNLGPELPFSGERFTPECVREMAYEHWHRYALASTLVTGSKVLDAACGEGYGSALMARQARCVDGVDLSTEAVNHARTRYQRDNLKFLNASVIDMPVSDNAYDVVVSFETLEHLAQQEEMLDEFARVLNDQGFLVISSPDRATYSDATGYNNEFHVKELYRDELVDLLQARFPAVSLMGQALSFQSMVWSLDNPAGSQGHQSLVLDNERVTAGVVPTMAPLYYVAICASKPANIPAMPTVSSFADHGQSVFAHYQHEIQKNMAAGTLLAERDAEIQRLKAQLAQHQAQQE